MMIMAGIILWKAKHWTQGSSPFRLLCFFLGVNVRLCLKKQKSIFFDSPGLEEET